MFKPKQDVKQSRLVQTQSDPQAYDVDSQITNKAQVNRAGVHAYSNAGQDVIQST